MTGGAVVLPSGRLAVGASGLAPVNAFGCLACCGGGGGGGGPCGVDVDPHGDGFNAPLPDFGLCVTYDTGLVGFHASATTDTRFRFVLYTAYLRHGVIGANPLIQLSAVEQVDAAGNRLGNLTGQTLAAPNGWCAGSAIGWGGGRLVGYSTTSGFTAGPFGPSDPLQSWGFNTFLSDCFTDFAGCKAYFGIP